MAPDSPDVVKTRARNGSSPFRRKDHQEPLDSLESVHAVSNCFFVILQWPHVPTALRSEPEPKSTAIGASNGPTCAASQGQGRQCFMRWFPCRVL